MATEVLMVSGALTPRPESAVPAVPWRDPHRVSPRDLAVYIDQLERRCLETPGSPVLWTFLGMAHAVNYDVAASMEALERATEVEPTYFWARLKCGELHYRLRTLDRAEDETLKALELAESAYQLAVARKQLREIRAINPRISRDGPASAVGRAVFLVMLLIFTIAVVVWK